MKTGFTSIVLAFCAIVVFGMLMVSCAKEYTQVVQEQETCTCQRATQKIVTNGETTQ